MTRFKILLVDDNPDFLETLRDFLEDLEGIEIVGTIESGEAALKQMPVLTPDLVLLDLVMPGIDGVTTTRLIKASFPQVHIVLLTMHDVAEYRQAAQEAGASAYVVKAEMYDCLEEVIANLMESLPLEVADMPKILIVDDSQTMRKMVKASLNPLKATFGEASSGLDAIEKLALQPYDLMTLDINMPDMHGLEVAQFVRGHSAYKELPILVLSTRDDEGTQQAARMAGVDGFMNKPFDPKELCAKVQEMLHR